MNDIHPFLIQAESGKQVVIHMADSSFKQLGPLESVELKDGHLLIRNAGTAKGILAPGTWKSIDRIDAPSPVHTTAPAQASPRPSR